MSAFASSKQILYNETIPNITLHCNDMGTFVLTPIEVIKEPIVKLDLRDNQKVTLLPDLSPMLKIIYDNPTKF